ncbi:MAG: hypothetical protein QXI16_06840 [Sulfolobaceae archaeon]
MDVLNLLTKLGPQFSQPSTPPPAIETSGTMENGLNNSQISQVLKSINPYKPFQINLNPSISTPSPQPTPVKSNLPKSAPLTPQQKVILDKAKPPANMQTSINAPAENVKEKVQQIATAMPPQYKNYFEHIVSQFSPEQAQYWLAIIAQESSNGAQSNNVMQVTQPALTTVNKLIGTKFTMKDMNNPALSMLVGTTYYAYMLNKNKSIDAAVTAYNGGGDPHYLQNVKARIPSLNVAGMNQPQLAQNDSRVLTQYYYQQAQKLLEEASNNYKQKTERDYNDEQAKLDAYNSLAMQAQLDLPEPPKPPVLRSFQKQLGFIGNLILGITAIIGAFRGGKLMNNFVNTANAFQMLDARNFEIASEEFKNSLQTYNAEYKAKLDKYNSLMSKIAMGEQLTENDYKVRENLNRQEYEQTKDAVTAMQKTLEEIDKMNFEDAKNAIELYKANLQKAKNEADNAIKQQDLKIKQQNANTYARATSTRTYEALNKQTPQEKTASPKGSQSGDEGILIINGKKYKFDPTQGKLVEVK